MAGQGQGRAAGFALVEALVATLVMAIGMLSLAGLQASLSRNADMARQRTEAVRLAEEKIECLRSFARITTAAASPNCNGAMTVAAWNDLTSNSVGDTFTGNVNFTRTWTVGGTAADPMRPISVTVAWTDRTGATQSAAISSVISNTAPADTAILGFLLPRNAAIRRPGNRNIDIPIPALDLGNGNSSYALSAAQYMVLSNVSGNVVQLCNPGRGTLTADVAQVLAAPCRLFTGYLLSEYVGADSAFPTGVSFSGVALDAALPGQSVVCQPLAAATDQNTGATIAGTKYYLCVVALAAPFRWSGTVRLSGVPTTGDNIVCRYQYTSTTTATALRDADAGTTPNERNVQPYVNVDRSLSGQNYLMATSTSASTQSLAGDTTSCHAVMAVPGVSIGVVHQNCRSRNGNRAAECPSW